MQEIRTSLYSWTKTIKKEPNKSNKDKMKRKDSINPDPDILMG